MSTREKELECVIADLRGQVRKQDARLAAALAREVKLREIITALNLLADDDRLPYDYAIAGELFHEANQLKSDDSALRERLKAERERCAGESLKHIAFVTYNKRQVDRLRCFHEMVAMIRAMED